MNLVSRRTFMRSSAFLVAAAQVHAQEADAGPAAFKAGLAVREVTPPPGAPMWGYLDRESGEEGVLDPLFAKAVVFEVEEQRVALVTIDAGRTLPPEALDRVRARVASAGVSHVAFAASHTHGGPVMEMEELPYLAAIETAFGDLIEEAAAGVTPVRIGVGKATFDISHNRRKITEDGKCVMVWRNEERVPIGPVDHEATIIKLEMTDGKPLATFVHYACHPVILGADNLRYSADWPGEMARIMKAETGAECVFLQGGCGDINPYLDKTPIAEGGVEAMRAVGQTCAQAALASWNNIRTVQPASPSLAYSQKTVTVGTRWDFTDPDQRAVFESTYGEFFKRMQPKLTPDLAVPISVLMLNGEIALAFMPGELFIEHQKELKRQGVAKETLLCGYANDFHLYFPTIRDAAAGGYGGVAATYVGIGAGDKLVMEAQVEVGKLAGLLRDFCRLEDFQLLEAKASDFA